MADLPIALMPKSKAEARLRGLPRYNDGKPCDLGHDLGRYTASGRCVICSRNAVGKGKPRHGYTAKSADPIPYAHGGAPLSLFSQEELAHDLTPGDRGPTGARH